VQLLAAKIVVAAVLIALVANTVAAAMLVLATIWPLLLVRSRSSVIAVSGVLIVGAVVVQVLHLSRSEDAAGALLLWAGLALVITLGAA
jgi:hypothetical protein